MRFGVRTVVSNRCIRVELLISLIPCSTRQIKTSYDERVPLACEEKNSADEGGIKPLEELTSEDTNGVHSQRFMSDTINFNDRHVVTVDCEQEVWIAGYGDEAHAIALYV